MLKVRYIQKQHEQSCEIKDVTKIYVREFIGSKNSAKINNCYFSHHNLITYQIQFSPRRQKGYGLTDGEGIERLWSFLRGFSSMTKEMSAGRRADILTDALLHYSARQLQQFGKYTL